MYQRNKGQQFSHLEADEIPRPERVTDPHVAYPRGHHDQPGTEQTERRY